MKADLHMHSRYSDGRLTVEELLECAKTKGLTMIALTDHDCVEGVAEAIEYGKKHHITVIPGLELSTYHLGESVHILGYFPGKIPDELHEFTRKQKETRRNRMIQYVKNLETYRGLKIDLEHLLATSPMLTRSHLADEILKTLPGKTKQDIFVEYLSERESYYVPSSQVSTEEGIMFLKRLGALTVLAHPTLLKINTPESIILMGVDGLEATYPRNKEGHEAEFLALAKKYHLVATAGSDFHYHGDRSHGDLADVSITGTRLEAFMQRLEKLL